MNEDSSVTGKQRRARPGWGMLGRSRRRIRDYVEAAVAVGVLLAVAMAVGWTYLPLAVVNVETPSQEQVDEQVWRDLLEAIAIFEEQLKLLKDSERNAKWVRREQWDQIQPDTKVVQHGDFAFAASHNAIATVVTVYSYRSNLEVVEGVAMMAFGDKAHAVIRGVPLLISFSATTLETAPDAMGGTGWQCSVAEPYMSVGPLRIEREVELGAAEYTTLVWEYCDAYLRARAEGRMPFQRPQLICEVNPASPKAGCSWIYESGESARPLF